MMNKIGFSGLAIVALALGVMGCESAPRQQLVLKACDISLKDAPKVKERSLTGAVLSFPFRVQNPNTVAVTLDHLNVNPTINGSELGSNLITSGITIGPNEIADVNIDYAVSFISGGLAVVDAIVGQSATIAIDGSAKIRNEDSRYDAQPLEHPFQIK
jgi:LEA14-like dessication related protein